MHSLSYEYFYILNSKSVFIMKKSIQSFFVLFSLILLSAACDDETVSVRCIDESQMNPMVFVPDIFNLYVAVTGRLMAIVVRHSYQVLRVGRRESVQNKLL